ncbi:MAG TPA: hypothetical protein VLT36_12735, partial [Candidatus Dormibacteraeota bacterium]|nr:hypothetical protein [Candidatus Dormibacteraeota bacterium]
NCRPEDAGQFYIADDHTAPVLELSRSLLEQHSYGRIYGARNFGAPDGLAYDVDAFSRFTDSVWRWIRKVGRRAPDAFTYSAARSAYFLPDAWSRYGSVAAYHAAEKKAHDDLIARNRKYCIEVLGGRPAKT